MSEYNGLEIAIIGMAGRFPNADNIDAFWNNLKEGVESISFHSNEELIAEGEEEAMKEPTYVKASSYLKGKEYFDSSFFDVLPDEARLMDPQVRLYHETIWEALEDAAIDPRCKDYPVGLYLGATNNVNWQVCATLMNKEGLVDQFSASQLSSVNFLSTRLSYFFDLKGPSIFSDTACSTSLVNVHQACRSLLLSDCKVAIAGGVRVANGTKRGYMYQEGMIYSKDGHCRTFDEKASGTIVGEGIGVVVLKKLKDALADGDNIHAIIKGSAVNNDGYDKIGYTAPAVKGQAEVILKAQAWAKISPESIGYIEAHGTATALGDPIEVEALNLAFGKSKEKYCALGSVKSNIGHLDTAAGVAGLIKTILSLKHKQIVPSLHYESPNPKINFADSPFFVNTELKEWTREQYPLRAGVSSFGIGGTNAHVVLEEAPRDRISSSSRPIQVLNLSAKTPEALKRNIQRLKEYLEQNPQECLADIAYTLKLGRTSFKYRSTVVGESIEEMIDQLSLLNLSDKITAIHEDKSKVAFMFPGQGAQYIGMCSDLYKSEETFRVEVDKCFEIVKSKFGKDIQSIIFSGTRNELAKTEFTQPALFIVEYALAKLLMSWGIMPDVMIGHSIGEYVAACLSSVFTLEDALLLVVKRGELMQKMPEGSMLSAGLSESEARRYVNQTKDTSLATLNSPSSCVISGTEEAIDQLKNTLDQNGVPAKKIETSHAFHSYMMDDMLTDFKEIVSQVKISAPKIPFISNLTGKKALYQEIQRTDYWVNHLRETVYFAQGLQTLMVNDQVVFIEVGPGKALSSFVGTSTTKANGHKSIPLMGRQKDKGSDLFHLLSALGKVWSYGVEPDWKEFYQGEKRLKISAPSYAFDKTKYPVNLDAFKMISEGLAGQELSFPQLADFPQEEEEIHDNLALQLSPTEKELLGIWVRFFGSKDIALDDDFFEIGGDSLKALTIIERINKRFEVEVSLTDFFEKSSVRNLALVIETKEKSSYQTIEKVEDKQHYVLSAAQERLYFLYEFDKKSTAYNMPNIIELHGKLDRCQLEKALKELVLRHESLRTSFVTIQGQVFQKISESGLDRLDYFELDGNEASDLIGKFISPFNLAQGPLIRVGLIKASDEVHILMVDLHHIITDGLSQSILVRDFMALYNGDTLAEVKIQYKDYSEWQQSESQRNRLEKQKSFWKNQFEEQLNVLELPIDFPRPVVKSYKGRSISFSLDVEKTNNLKLVGQDSGATTFMTVLSIFNVLLSKLANSEDVVVGTTVVGRNHSDLEDVMGMFVNTLAFRNFPRQDISFETFLQEVKERSLACFDNQSYAFEELLQELQIVRDTNRNPLFDVLLEFQGFQQEELIIPGLDLKPYDSGHEIAKFDLSLLVREVSEQLHFTIEYSTDLFTDSTIARFVEYFKQIARTVTQDPRAKLSEISVLPEEEKELLVHGFNQTQAPRPKNETVLHLFEKCTSVSSSKIALVHDSLEVTYQELLSNINQVANHMTALGISKGDIVGVIASKSVELVTYAYAIMKMGAVYLPIEPSYPRKRIEYILENSGAKKVVLERGFEELIPRDLECVLMSPSFTNEYTEYKGPSLIDEDLAYIIYTSGSTGLPKGVKISHASFCNYIHWAQKFYSGIEQEPMALFTSISFDLTITSMFLPLTLSSSLHVYDDAIYDQTIKKILLDKKVSALKLTPAHLKFLTGSDLDFSHLKILIVGGEAFDVDLAAKVFEKGQGQINIYNEYGPTEATIGCSAYRYNSDTVLKTKSLLIGKPVDNTQIYILDQHMNILPQGVLGEVYIGGTQVGQGYINNDELTSEKFVSDPFGKGKKLYKTGDLARWWPDGNLEFYGRIDDQVKIRGFRIELGEVESQLLAYDSVTQVAIATKQRRGETFLVAYFVAANMIDSTLLKDHLLLHLPDYMIPSFFVQLEDVPLTINGKVDKRALPDPDLNRTTEDRLPQGSVETQLVEIWSDVLGLDKTQINVDRSFFELGGHSLKAVTMIGQVNDLMTVDLSIIDVFEYTSIDLLGKHIAGLAETVQSKIEPADNKSYYALSSAQSRMYFLHQMDRESLAYNMPQVVELEGKLSIEKLSSVFQNLIEHHESLRTSFDLIDDEVIQKINEHVDFEMDYFKSENANPNTIIEQFIRPFDLSEPSMLRVGLIELSSDKHLLIVDMHHIITDGVSQGIFINDFMTLYKEEELNKPLLQYKDYSEWQRTKEQQERLAHQREFWLQQFAEPAGILDLPVDFLRPKVKNHQGDRIDFVLDEALTSALIKVADREEATMFMVILATFNVLLSKLTNQEDVVVGTPVAGRDHADTSGIIGPFINTLTLRNHPRGDLNFVAFLNDVKRKVVASFDNQSYPYEELIEDLEVVRNTSRNPLFDVMLVFQNFDETTLTIPGLKLNPYHTNHAVSKFDLTLTATEGDKEMYLSLEYATDLFKGQSIQRFISYFLQIVDAVVKDPSIKIADIEVLSAKERTQLLETFNDTQVDYPRGKTIIDLFESQVERTPQAIALRFQEETVSYSMFQRKVNQMVGALIEKGVKKDHVVGIMSDRSIELMIGIFGILKAGAAYLPISPNHPMGRIDYIIEDSGMELILVSNQYEKTISTSIDLLLLGSIEESRSEETTHNSMATPDALAYIIYTSGSTGNPKGVMVEHGSLVNRINWMSTRYPIGLGDVVLQKTPLIFDVSVWELFWWAIDGATLCLLPSGDEGDPKRLLDIIAQREITTMHFVPSMLQVFMEYLENKKNGYKELVSLKQVFSSGEVLRSHHVNKFSELLYEKYQTKLTNLYGPTEATIDVSYYDCYGLVSDDRIPIGRPIDNVQLYVLNNANKLLPLGVAGELCISGTGLSRGYLNQETLTSESFIKNPFIKSGRLYKTGDMARWLPNGNLEYLGRKDHQVKIRGYRIELGEIESQLVQHEMVKGVLAMLKGSEDEQLLVAYYTSEAELAPDELIKFLSQQLPEYMLPSRYVHLTEFPVTPNGKIDRKALLDIEFIANQEYEAPTNEIERKLAAIWSDVLNVDQEKISTNDSFFGLGGHSLKAVSLVNRMSRELEVKIPLKEVFTYQNIKNLSTFIQELDNHEEFTIDPAPQKEYYSLSAAQRRLYFLYEFDKTTLAYNMSRIEGLDEKVDKEVLKKTFDKLILRHESLRTYFKVVDGQPVQIIKDAIDFEIEYYEADRSTVSGIVGNFIRPFDLSEASLFRVGLIEVPDEPSLLMVDMAHIITDGVSQRVLMEEFKAIHFRKENLPDLTLQYKDYAEWQNLPDQRKVVKAHEAYWVNELNGHLPVLNLPTDFERTDGHDDSGSSESAYLGFEEYEILKQYCHVHNTTASVLLYGLFSIVLTKLSGQNDIIVGLSSTGRNHADLERIIGMFVNSLPVRSSPAGDKFLSDYLLEVRSLVLNALDNQSCQFDQLVSTLGLERHSGRNPIFDVMLNFIGRLDGPVDLAETSSDAYVKSLSKNRRFDLTLNVAEFDNTILLNLQYDTSLFRGGTIADILKYLVNSISSLKDCNGVSIYDIELQSQAIVDEVLLSLEEPVQATKEPNVPTPASYHQERLWFINKFESGYLYENSPVYHNVPLILNVKGALDVNKLEHSLNKVIERHSILRTAIFDVEERPFQHILPMPQISLDIVKGAVEEVQEKVREEVNRAFELDQLLVRGLVFCLAKDKYQLVLTFHHLIVDRYSLGIIAKEITTCYQALVSGTTEELGDDPIEYSTFSMWQKDSLSLLDVDALSYWKHQLSGSLQKLELPLDRERAVIHTFSGASLPIVFTEELTNKLADFAKDFAIEEGILLMAVFKVLLRKYSRENEVIIGANFDNRESSVLKNAVGPISNLLVVRSHIESKATFMSFLAELQMTWKRAHEFGGIPFDKLVQAISPEKDMSRTALFDVLFEYQETNLQLADGNALKVELSDTNYGYGKYDLNLYLERSQNGLTGSLVYNADYFDAATIQQVTDHFCGLLPQVIAEPDAPISELTVLSKQDEKELLKLCQNTQVEYPKEKTVIGLFEEQVANHPDYAAVICEGKVLTYKELNSRCNQVANGLLKYELERDNIVALLMDRSIDTVVGMLGILKAGGAYLPIDVDYPEERIRYLIEDSKADLLLTTKDVENANSYHSKAIYIEETQSESMSAPDLISTCAPSDLCYIIYTSGTTGNPKGVMVEHRNVVRLFFNSEFQFDFGPKDIWTMFHGHTFDFSVWEMYGALLFGGKLVIVPKMIARDPHMYLKLLVKEEVTVLNQTPGAFYNLIREHESDQPKGLNLRYVIFGGEALNVMQLKDWKNIYPETKLVNMFGITETTVHVTYKEISQEDILQDINSIGKPIPTLTAYIMDEEHRLVPRGVKGELCIGGAGVARGYLNNESLTNDKFIINPYDSTERLYLSGDMGRIGSDGELQYLGRLDDQVKIRGFRIELGEIESQLSNYPKIEQTVVEVRVNEEEKFLVGYYVSDVEIDSNALRNYLKERIPDYMLPAYYVHVKHMPLTVNGKVDRKRLPDPQLKSGTNYKAPMTTEQQVLCEIWSQVLGVETIGIKDNFFSMGGDSIKSIQISARARSKGFTMSVKDIFTNQTVEELAGTLKTLEHISDQSTITGQVPLTGIQNWFFRGNVKSKDHFNQAVILSFDEKIDKDEVVTVFTELMRHHDALRIVFKQEGDLIVQENLGEDPTVVVEVNDLTRVKDPNKKMLSACNKIQSSIDLSTGPLVKLGLFDLKEGSRLLVVIHHLVIDAISWRILFEDIDALVRQLRSGSALNLPLKTDSFKSWSQQMLSYASSPEHSRTASYWQKEREEQEVVLQRDSPSGKNQWTTVSGASFKLSKERTNVLLKEAHQAFNTGVNDLLVTAFLMSVNEHYGSGALRLDMESHGREEIFEKLDVSRTVGWFTSIYPVVLNHKSVALSDLVKEVKEALRKVPNNGFDYLIGRHLITNAASDTFNEEKSQVLFNYLGQFDSDTEQKVFEMAHDSPGNTWSPKEEREYEWDVSGMVSGSQLSMSITYGAEQYTEVTMSNFMSSYQEALETLIDHCSNSSKNLTPSDLTYSNLEISEIDSLQEEFLLQDVYPLSAMQEGMLFHAVLDEEAHHYFEQMSYRLNGSIDIAAMERSYEELIKRHTILRTIFLHKGYDKPIQVLLAEKPGDFTYLDVREEVKTSSREELVLHHRKKDKLQKFDLGKDILMRVKVLHLSDTDYEFIWSHHHIVMDGWCMSIIINEFTALYDANRTKSQALLPPPSDYSRYLNWMMEKDMSSSLIHWKDYLVGYQALASIPGSLMIPGESMEANLNVTLNLSKHQTEGLQQLSKSHGVTLNTIIQSIWGVLLARYNNVNDVVFGAVVSGRPAEVEGIESMIGLFINTIPVRIRYNAEDKMSDLFEVVHRNAIENEMHHYSPLSDIQSVTDLGMGLINHILVFENYPIASKVEGIINAEDEQGGYAVTGVETFEQTNYDLSVVVIPGDRLKIRFDYNPSVYDRHTLEGVQDHLTNIVNQVLSEAEIVISEIDLLSSAERTTLLHEFNDNCQDYEKDLTIVDLFERQAKKTPEAIGLIHHGKKTTYTELNSRANQLANQLKEKGIGRNMVVGIMLDRSFEMIVSIIATLKSGAAYLPIDADYPESRISFMLTNSEVSVLLTDSSATTKTSDYKGSIINVTELEFSETLVPNLPAENEPTDLFYVIYTSGSTGTPKGVMLKHSNLTNLVHFDHECTPIDFSCVLQFTTLSFDPSFREIFSTLLKGGQLVLADTDDIKDVNRLFSIIKENEVRTLFMPGSLLNQLFNDPDISSSVPSTIRHIVSAGEQTIVGDTFKGYLRNHGIHLYNHYGPSETHVVTGLTIAPDSEIPTKPCIGGPICNTQIYVLDTYNNLQPIGVLGELYAGGDQVGLGYYNNVELTADRFVPNPFCEGEILYRTGDLARWMPDGTIEFIGRIDDQVKIRGFRVELGEVESRLSEHDQIKEVAVVALEQDGEKHLVSYYVCASGLDPGDLRGYMSEQLPDFMVPAHFIPLEELPVTLNGKIDKKSLPAPEFVAGADYATPSREVEHKLVEIWSDILKIDKEVISVKKSFFALGGHSLKAMVLVNRIFKELDVNIPLKEIFTNPTIQDQADISEAVYSMRSEENDQSNLIEVSL